MAVNYMPPGARTITPHLVIRGATKAMDFYKAAFGAEEHCRMPGPGGALMHAEMKIGDSVFYLCEEFPEYGAKSPDALNGSPVTIHLYVPNADAAWDRAVKAGATVEMPLENAFWGDRYGKLKDPFGHKWSIAQHIEDVTPEEMEKRMSKMCG